MSPLRRVPEEERLRARCERLIEERDAALERARRAERGNEDLRRELTMAKQIMAGPRITASSGFTATPSTARSPRLRLVKP